jgi:DNA-directed RNA polymerase specialized sigma24 family protein
LAQGALALFDLDSLTEALRSLDELTIEEARQVAEFAFVEQFHALLGLTTGERRVHFCPTEGWAAQDIAEELVAPLTTVHSHI